MPGSRKTTHARKTSTAPKLGTVAATDTLAGENARLLAETQRLSTRRGSPGHQTATAEILRVISSSPTDVQPVFDAIVGTALRHLSCVRTAVLSRDGNTYSPVAAANMGGLSTGVGRPVVPIDPATNFPSRVFVDKTLLHIPDWSAIDLPEYERRIHESTRCESSLMLPLLREGECHGVLVLLRAEARAFSDRDIALAKSFVDQAVIAIENVRLFNETQEALGQQTATADILRVISSSPTDVQPVFEAIVGTALRLLSCVRTAVLRRDGNTFSPVAAADHGRPSPWAWGRSSVPIDPAANFPSRVFLGKTMLHIPDWSTIDLPDYERQNPGTPRRLRIVAHVAALARRRDASVCSCFTALRRAPSARRDIALAKSFVDQAVIAIENVRLFNETKEALSHQTATADMLRVISRSPTDLQPVFDAIARNSRRSLREPVCERLPVRRRLILGCPATGTLPMPWRFAQDLSVRPSLAQVSGRVMLIDAIVRMEDVLVDPDYDHGLPMPEVGGACWVCRCCAKANRLA